MDFKDALKNYFDTATTIHDLTQGEKGRKVWANALTRFLNSCVSDGEIGSAKASFLDFVQRNRDFFVQPIFYVDEFGKKKVNDSFLKQKTQLAEREWVGGINFNGPTILIKDGEKTYLLPLGEPYRESVSLYVKNKEACDSVINSLPSRILLDIFHLAHSCSESDEELKSNIKKNVDVVTDVYETISPKKKQPSGGFSDILEQVMGMVNGGGNSGAAISKVTEALKTVAKKVGEFGKDGGQLELKDVIGKIGEAMQTDEVVEAVRTASGIATDLLKSIPRAPAAPTKALESAEEVGEPSEQN